MSTFTINPSHLVDQLMKQEPNSIKQILEPALTNHGRIHKNHPSGWKLKHAQDETLPSEINKGGVYIFWWVINDVTKDRDEFLGKVHPFTKKGKAINEGGKKSFQKISVEVNRKWLERFEQHIPLYVGKTEGDILKRMRLHLKINQRVYSGKTTTDQLRRGFNELFKSHKEDTSSLIVDHVGFSFIPLDGHENAVNRFYLENYAIGRLTPIINVDVER